MSIKSDWIEEIVADAEISIEGEPGHENHFVSNPEEIAAEIRRELKEKIPKQRAEMLRTYDAFTDGWNTCLMEVEKIIGGEE